MHGGDGRAVLKLCSQNQGSLFPVEKCTDLSLFKGNSTS